MTDVHTPSTWVGVDVSKKKFDVYFERPDGRGKSKVFPNDAEGFAALLAWGPAQGVDWMQTGVCLEATGPYGKPLACALHEAGVVVAIENPARIQAFARLLGARVKTDRAEIGGRQYLKQSILDFRAPDTCRKPTSALRGLARSARPPFRPA
jgi:hypothetical protein